MAIILIVEDDTALRETLVYNLSRQEMNIKDRRADANIERDLYDYNCHT